MTKQELVMETLKQMGYRPSIDTDGDVKFRYNMRTYYAQLGDGEQEDHPFVSLLLPNITDVEEQQISTMLLVCNKAARQLKLVKLCLDGNLSRLHAFCEFFYRDQDSLREYLEHSMKILSIMPVWVYECYHDLSDSE